MKANKYLGAALLVCAVLGVPAAFADSVTYDFTGTVTSATGIYSSIADGTTVTGTYTFTLANGIPSQSTLPVSTTSNWQIEEQSGTDFSIASNSAYVFSSTATVGAFSYQTSTVPGAYSSLSEAGGSNGGATYVAGEVQQTASTSAVFGSAFEVNSPSGNPYSLDGLPVFSGATTGFGLFLANGSTATNEDEVEYNLASVTPAPVPLPAPAWLLLSALGGLGLLTHRSQRRSPAAMTAISPSR